MGDTKVLAQADRDILHKADSGALRFKVKFADINMSPSLSFFAKVNPENELYKIIIGRIIRIKNKSSNSENESRHISNFDHREPIDYWVTWHSRKIQIGLEGQTKPLITHRTHSDELIGYVKFDTVWRFYDVQWTIEVSPVHEKPSSCKIFDGELTWARMTENELPPDALIGGYEKEPIYVARAHCNNSLCPGKYVPTNGMAFIPWGHQEIGTHDFEILCGYNAKWVKTKSNCIPQDAFVAGYSEVRREPLYVGRAKHDGCMVVGKVHALYKLCYLPYYGEEIPVAEYEILTVPKVPRCVKMLV